MTIKWSCGGIDGSLEVDNEATKEEIDEAVKNKAIDILGFYWYVKHDNDD